METSSYPARYGNAAGAIVAVVTKSGTNQFHGSVYDYHRNKVLDALPWKFNRPREEAPNYLYNQFGFTFGGPIRKDKTFFFINLEMLRQRPTASRQLSWAPNARERAGDSTQSTNPWTGGPVTLTDPYSAAPWLPNMDPVASSPQPQPQWNGILPESLISPVGKRLMEVWPEPNIEGADPFYNLQVYRTGKTTSDKWVTRVDHNFNARNNLYGNFIRDNTHAISTGLTEYVDKDNLNQGNTSAVHYTSLISSTATNDLSFNFTRFQAGSLPALRDKNYAVEWGMDPRRTPPWVRLGSWSLVAMVSIGGEARVATISTTPLISRTMFNG